MENKKNLKILHLTLKKRWFDMIASGEKKEEYREIKMYWADRLMTGFPSTYGVIERINPDFKHFDVVQFRNGYSKNAPTMSVECLGISIDQGYMDWGAEKYEEYFVIQLGKIIESPTVGNKNK